MADSTPTPNRKAAKMAAQQPTTKSAASRAMRTGSKATKRTASKTLRRGR